MMADLTLDKKKKINEIEDIAIETIQNKTKRNKNKLCTTVLWDNFEQLTIKELRVPEREREMGGLKQG